MHSTVGLETRMHAKETPVGRRIAIIRTANDKPRQNWYRRNQETERSATLSLDPTIMAKFKTKKRNGCTPKSPDYAKKHERNTKFTANSTAPLRNQQREPRKRNIWSPIPKIHTLERPFPTNPEGTNPPTPPKTTGVTVAG